MVLQVSIDVLRSLHSDTLKGMPISGETIPDLILEHLCRLF